MSRPVPPYALTLDGAAVHRVPLPPPALDVAPPALDVAGPYLDARPALDVDPSRLAPRDRAPLDGEVLAALRALVERCTPRSVAAATGLGHTTVRRALRGERVSSLVRRTLGALVRVAPTTAARAA